MVIIPIVVNIFVFVLGLRMFNNPEDFATAPAPTTKPTVVEWLLSSKKTPATVRVYGALLAAMSSVVVIAFTLLLVRSLHG